MALVTWMWGFREVMLGLLCFDLCRVLCGWFVRVTGGDPPCV